MWSMDRQIFLRVPLSVDTVELDDVNLRHHSHSEIERLHLSPDVCDVLRRLRKMSTKTGKQQQ